MDALDDELKNARILIIDDERGSAYGLARILQMGGYAICITMTDPQECTNGKCTNGVTSFDLSI